MESRIRSRMFLVGLLSLLLTATMGMYVFEKAFDRQVRADVRQACELIAHGYEYTDDQEYLVNTADTGQNLRLTLISSNGDVLYESDAEGPMDNHMDRQEVREALETGSGEEVRVSSTLGYDTYYYALRLENGQVLRVAANVRTMYDFYDQVTPSMVLVGIVVMVAAFLVSVRLTRAFVNSITAMADSIDTIRDHIPYKELQPFAEALAQKRAQELENQRMRQEFTSNVSHELKTPLTSISGYAEMIEMGMARESDVKEFAGRIRTESRRLLRLIADILRLGELDYPAREPEWGEVELDQLVLSVMDRLQYQSHQAYVTMKSKLDPVKVWADESMITEVCYNLCDNAIRYNRPGGTVLVTVFKEGNEAVIRVKDSGIGIPKEAQDRIFERFYRVDKSRSKETGGTGLGLAIVKHAVAQCGGRIEVRSELGIGTEITVYIPKDPQNV